MSRSFGGLLATLLLAFTVDAQAGFEVTAWTTSNGARVLFVPAPEIPMVDVRVVFAAGGARDAAQAGLARLANSLLSEGAGERDVEAYSAALGATGAIIGNGSQRDMAYVSLRTMRDARYADPALALFIDTIARPRFEASAFERAVAQTQIGLKHKEQSPEDIAEDTFFASVYGSHPYGSPPDGTPTSIGALTRTDVQKFHQRYYVAKNAVIAIVGALTRSDAETWAERISTPLPAGERAAPLPTVAPTQGATMRVDFPSIQSHIRVGLPGISRIDPDYFALVLGNHALGGNSLSSLLSREIRSKRGITYGVSSYFTPMAQAGPFLATLQTDASQEKEALAALKETIERFIADGPPADALEAARQNLIGGFPLRLASNNQVAEYIAMMGVYDLPLDYLATYVEHVAAVTPAEVKDAFRRRIVPEQMITVIVGRGADNQAKP